MAVAIKYELDVHEGKNVILIKFPYDKELVERVKKLVGVKWSRSKKAWYVLDTSQYREKFGMEEKVIGKEAILKIAEINKANFQRFLETLHLKSYSKSTIKTYSTEFASFLCTIKNKDAKEISAEKLRAYFLYCLRELEMTENHLHSRINAIKFFYEQVLHNEKLFFEIPRPKKPLLQPKVLSLQEITKLFSVIDNQKHLLMLQLCYGMGLRVSEVVQLKINDIDSQRMQVFIERAKGKKDRYVTLPDSILDLLRNYYISYKPKIYLFEGQYGGKYSIRSVQSVFKQAMDKAKIRKEIGIHGLRHSYATHLLEYGTDISLIQKLLGHNDIKTTLIYTHVTNKELGKVQSPLDRLKNSTQ